MSRYFDDLINDTSADSLEHFGIKGQKWGRRNYQYEDGSLTPEGKIRYGVGDSIKKRYGTDAGLASSKAKLKAAQEKTKTITDAPIKKSKSKFIESVRVARRNRKILEARSNEHVLENEITNRKAAIRREEFQKAYKENKKGFKGESRDQKRARMERQNKILEEEKNMESNLVDRNYKGLRTRADNMQYENQLNAAIGMYAHNQRDEYTAYYEAKVGSKVSKAMLDKYGDEYVNARAHQDRVDDAKRCTAAALITAGAIGLYAATVAQERDRY